MEHPALGHDDDLPGRMFAGEFHHPFGAAHLVGEVAHGLHAFGVGDDGRAGELQADFFQCLDGEQDMRVAASRPELQAAPGLSGHPLAQVLVGHKEDLPVGRHPPDDFHGVAARADDIAEGLHSRGAVDVGDNGDAGMGRLVSGQLLRRTRIGERTPGLRFGQQHEPPGIHDLGRFGHEMDAAEEDDIRPGLGRLIGKAERIAHEVGHALDRLDLVVVGEDHGASAPLQLDDLLLQFRQGRGLAALRREDEGFIVEYRGHAGKVAQTGRGAKRKVTPPVGTQPCLRPYGIGEGCRGADLLRPNDISGNAAPAGRNGEKGREKTDESAPCLTSQDPPDHTAFPMLSRRTSELHANRWSQPGMTYFVTCCTRLRKKGLDAFPVREVLRGIVVASDAGGDTVTDAFTVMPDHIHWLFTLGDRLSLGRIIARLKAQTGGTMGVARIEWQRDFFDHRLRPDEAVKRYGLYVFLNPYRAGLVAARENGRIGGAASGEPGVCHAAES